MAEHESDMVALCERRKHCMCTSNFFLVTAMVMQIVAMSESEYPSDCSLESLAFANMAFVLGLFVLGPVGAFLVDRFCRQSVYRSSLLVAAAASAVLYFGRSAEIVASVRFVEGMMYGLAQVALGSTLLNDLAASELRTSSDYSFAWAALLAIPAGAGLACFLMGQFGFNVVIAVAIIMLLLSVVLVSSMNVPFRAPIHSAVFGLDRFWQKNDMLPFLNLLFISVPAGVFIASLSSPLYYALAAVGVVAAHSVRRAVFRNADVRAEIVTGLVCMCFSLLIFMLRDTETPCRVAAFMFGAGISLASTRFLLYFLKLTGHCQRGTAQNTYLLSRECGYALGFLLAFIVPVLVEVSLALLLLSTAFYLLVTHPWFMRHNDRGFRFREV